MLNEERTSRRRRRQNKSRTNRKKQKNLLYIFLILFGFVIIYLLFFYKKSNNNKFSFASSNIYNEKLKNYNRNIYYKKYNSKDGKYALNEEYRFLIENKVKNNYESYIYEKLKEYLDKNNIIEENLSLYIKKGNTDLLKLNDEIKYDNIEILPLMKLIVVRNAIDNKIIKVEDNMILDRSDLVGGSKIYNESSIGTNIKLDRIINEAYINNDNAAKNILDRYLAYRGIRIKEYLGDYFNEHDFIHFSVKDISKVLELYDNKSNTLSSVFEHYLREKNDLYLKSIFSTFGNKNMLKKDTKSYDYGLVNSNNKYYYAIYFENIDDKHINNIGDLINRTIEEVENSRSIQTR
ncbi:MULTISPECIES: serine hydrolase [Helcococcus]|uniref:Serine hydrolase n=1 Tax=Helcococcus bovis TaxID=3153252 RepID=A0ABW9F8B8_9FIRM